MNYLSFISYVLITTFTPGPNNIMSLINAGKAGVRKGLKFNVGVFFGFTIVMLLCGGFSHVLGQMLPVVKPIMKYVGALYIVWLAIKIFKSSYAVENENTALYGFKEGLSLQFVNPKVILYGMTTLSTFVLPHYESRLAILLFALGLALVGFIATLSWALFGSIFHSFLIKREKVVNAVLSIVLLVTAVSIVL
ncbi:lysine transporter LysE [Acidaminobacter sp. JC074]|uniref:LysE family transporter n=1 Tax=Acidaminobacter sp. JC074 TaxID=2530199 RepID=UPI001F0DB276|nr:LysE family transporter [Acidaminobacter sp. JC074]MCH4887273.1 lysine transporter LysE [Acidaminobacter sp. JC074]